MSFTDEELQEFKTEANDLLDIAEQNLLIIDTGEFETAFDAVFRSFHNLKGAAGMMELEKLQSHIHELESLLVGFKHAKSIPKEYVNLFLRGVDAAKSILNGQDVSFSYQVTVDSATTAAIDTTPPPPKNVESPAGVYDIAYDEFIAEGEEVVERVSNALQLIENKSHTKDTVEGLYRDIHSLKGSAYLFSYTVLGDLAHTMESKLDGLRSGSVDPTPDFLHELFRSLQAIEATITDMRKRGQPETPAEKPQEPTTAKSKDANSTAIKEREAEGSGSIRVPISLLDNLMTLMGEMVLVRNQVLQFSNKSEDLEFLNLSKRLNAVTSEIQGEMMKTRMQPIGNVLSKFSRVVRDLSHDLKKEINLNVSGAETELDKSLLESIKDPLTHIVRNSCDHGIEVPEIRQSAGKPRHGTIHIRAYHEGGQVVIDVSDDGRGLNRETLIKKALEKGIIKQTQVTSMGEKEIFNLIFAPGFSTAATVTNVSGRGVGMDVVRTNIEKIGGTVELQSRTGHGTTIKLKIPLTLAIVPALIVKCANQTFAIPQVKLEELVRVDQASSENKIEFLHGAPVYRLRENILPLVNLNKILNTNPSESKSINNIAVLNADQFSFGLVVDEVQDTADIVVKPITRLLKTLQIYSGATILGDGSIALILDVLGISKVAHINEENSLNESFEIKKTEEKKNIDIQEFLIVHLDSPTKHAIVLNYVHRLEEFKYSDVEYSGSQKVVRYGEYILPLISLSEKMGYSSNSSDASSELFPVVVIQKAGALYGLVVKEIVDTLATDIEVDTSLVHSPGIFGNLNTPNGLIVAIDPFEIINQTFPELANSPQIQKTSGNTVTTESVTQKTQTRKVHTNQKLQILLVEDTAFFRRAIASVLTKAGHEVIMALDGKEALELLEKNPKQFDMVVSDIEMPRMNGFELAQAIRINPNTSSLPLLAISSRADTTYSNKGIESGFDVYMEKLKPDYLINTVSDLAASHRRAS